jgi:hypothetical protein
MVRVVFDPHQSPIWFKAVVLVKLHTAPGPWGPQKTFGAMPIPFALLQIIWF